MVDSNELSVFLFVCLIYGIIKNNILRWRWTWFLRTRGRSKRSGLWDCLSIINKYTETMKSDMHCSHTILKALGLLFDRWGRCLFNVWIIYFWMRISDFSTANLRLILGFKSGWGMSRRLSQLKLLLTHPKFLPICHGWNFPGSALYPSTTAEEEEEE